VRAGFGQRRINAAAFGPWFGPFKKLAHGHGREKEKSSVFLP